MSLENPLQYPQEDVWFAWYPVRVSGEYVWLKTIGRRTLEIGGTNFAGQPTYDGFYEYFNLEERRKK